MTRNNQLSALILLTALTSALLFHLPASGSESETPAPAPLYERLGAWEGIEKVVRDTIALHHANPEISAYFEGVDDEVLTGHVTAFFAAGTGGPSKYEGRDMGTAHAGMAFGDAQFDSAVADVLKACDMNGLGQGERAEVAAILESLRPAVMASVQD
jgi:hemoglobin